MSTVLPSRIAYNVGLGGGGMVRGRIQEWKSPGGDSPLHVASYS